MTIFNESLADGLKIGEHPGRIFHVSKHASASDSNDGSNATTKAWATIQKAATTMIAGDIVYVHAGTYTERVTSNNEGTAISRITIQAYPGDTVIIDGAGIGGGNSGNGLVYISSESYWTIDGFTISNTEGCSGVALYGECHGVILKNLKIYNCDISGIHVTYDWGSANPTMITDLIIDNCEIYNVCIDGDQEGISLLNVTGFEIKNCKVYSLPYPAGEFTLGKEGIDCKCGCSDGLIHDCEVYGAKIGIYIDPGDGASDNIDIYNCKLHDNRESGIYLDSEGTHESLTDCVIYNNLIWHNADSGFRVGATATFDKTFTLINNTFYNNHEYEIRVQGVYGDTISCIVRNNITYSIQGNSYCVYYADYATSGLTVAYNCWYNSAGGFNTSSRKGTNYIEANPQFQNIAVLDFALLASSPCINEGSTTAAPATDYTGASRDAEPDMGAYEYRASGGRINKFRSIPGMKDLYGGGMY